MFGGVTLGPGRRARRRQSGDAVQRIDRLRAGRQPRGVQLAGDLTIELWLNVSLATRQTLISKDYLHEFELTLETSGQLNFYQGNGDDV